jgi:lysophospholipase L1-like esterase
VAGAGGSAGSGGSPLDGGGMGGAAGAGGSTSGTFNPCAAVAACKIMPLGDSITEGYGTSTGSGGPANQGGYRIELFRQTVKNSKNATFVGNQTNGPTTVESKPFPQKHEGHGGWTISQIAGIADGTLSTNKPSIVLLKIGTNDINSGGSAAAPNGLKNLIDQIAKDVPSALLVVSSIIPIKDDNTNSWVKTYNATIPTAVSAAAAAGKHVVFVDAYAAFVANANWKTALMYDNLHPNDTGYALLGQTWYAAISAVLPAGP